MLSEKGDSESSAPGQRLRFVIQHHRTKAGEHWDLMLEEGEVLQTWQLGGSPEAMAGGPVAARKILPHRKLYLTYEGPVSHGLGTVRIVERGTYRLLERREELIRLELLGDRLGGRFDLSRPDPETDHWILGRASHG